MRDFYTQSKKAVIIFQMKVDPDLMWESRVSTLWRGRMIEMRDFFTQSHKSVLVFQRKVGPDLMWER